MWFMMGEKHNWTPQMCDAIPLDYWRRYPQISRAYGTAQEREAKRRTPVSDPNVTGHKRGRATGGMGSGW